jgi:hypothetical protein
MPAPELRRAAMRTGWRPGKKIPAEAGFNWGYGGITRTGCPGVKFALALCGQQNKKSEYRCYSLLPVVFGTLGGGCEKSVKIRRKELEFSANYCFI